jgi:stage II sporulation protein D (peptidoglycan lytic transglycosylase)
VKPRASLIGTTLVLGALAALFQGCAHRAPARPPATVPERPPVVVSEHPPVAVPARPPEALTLRVKVGTRVEMVPLEEYVAGCVAAELGSIDLLPAAAARARDVQAVLCRSYAVASLGRHGAEGFDLCSTTHCQLFRPVPPTVIGRLSREAAARTAGQLLLLAGRPVQPSYHSDCGGHTTTPGEVWGGDSPSYLVSAPDDACPRRPAWQLEVTLAQLSGILKAAPATVVEGPLREVAVERRDGSGRAAWIRLTGQRARVVRGSDFRAAVMASLGPSSLQSTLFDVVQRKGVVRFEGHGNGHGVGLCEAGMIARARRGDTPTDILAHYFPGTTVGFPGTTVGTR